MLLPLPVIELSPADIRFMHDCIRKYFQNGNSVNATVENIADGKWPVKCLPRIRVVNMNGYYFTFDNRRLYVYRVLHFRGLLKTVEVSLAPLRQFQPHKFSTKNKGKSIYVRCDDTLKHWIEPAEAKTEATR